MYSSLYSFLLPIQYSYSNYLVYEEGAHPRVATRLDYPPLGYALPRTYVQAPEIDT